MERRRWAPPPKQETELSTKTEFHTHATHVLVALPFLLNVAVAAADDLTDLLSALAQIDGRTISTDTGSSDYELTWDGANKQFLLEVDSQSITDVVTVNDVTPITFTAINIGSTPEVSGSASKTSSSNLRIQFVIRPPGNSRFELTVDVDLNSPEGTDPIEFASPWSEETCKCVGGTTGCTTTECELSLACSTPPGTCKWVKKKVIQTT